MNGDVQNAPFSRLIIGGIRRIDSKADFSMRSIRPPSAYDKTIKRENGRLHMQTTV